jgi:hypothetical protein
MLLTGTNEVVRVSLLSVGPFGGYRVEHLHKSGVSFDTSPVDTGALPTGPVQFWGIDRDQLVWWVGPGKLIWCELE